MSIVFRVNVPITSSPAIWFLVFMGVGLLIFVLVFNQKERFNLTEKLLSMELATLKNNMNGLKSHQHHQIHIKQLIKIMSHNHQK